MTPTPISIKNGVEVYGSLNLARMISRYWLVGTHSHKVDGWPGLVFLVLLARYADRFYWRSSSNPLEKYLPTEYRV
jgi:hypothetical protein